MRSFFTVVILFFTAACVGNLHEDDNSDFANTQSAGNGNTVLPQHLPPLSACTGGDTPAPRALRRLTTTEINNTLIDLFSDPAAPQSPTVFDYDPELYTFHNVASRLQVNATGAGQIQSLAEQVGAYAAQNLSKVTSCQTADNACEQSFIQSFGLKTFRAPLTSSQVSDYLQLMQSMPSFAAGVGAVVDAMLQSPYFLYRFELGQAGSGGYALTPYEVSTELSYLLTASTPDATLLQLAKNGTIMQASVRTAQVQRLMQTPRAHAALDEFFAEWLGVADLPRSSRTQGTDTMTPQIAADLLSETKTTVDNLLFSGTGTFSDLHSINYTYANEDLVAYYGLSGSGGNSFVKVSTQGVRDVGILMQGGVISAASEVNLPSPVLRGRMLREHILCQSMQSPPPGLKVSIPSSDNPNQTTRETYSSHLTAPICSGCHTLMDPMAYTMGNYDTVGRQFTSNMENGQAIDTSGTVFGLEDGVADVSLSTGSDLSHFVAQSDQAKACAARHWAMYGLGNIDWAQDGCTFDAVTKIAQKSNFNLTDIITALTQVTSFTNRAQDP